MLKDRINLIYPSYFLSLTCLYIYIRFNRTYIDKIILVLMEYKATHCIMLYDIISLGKDGTT